MLCKDFYINSTKKYLSLNISYYKIYLNINENYCLNVNGIRAITKKILMIFTKI